MLTCELQIWVSKEGQTEGEDWNSDFDKNNISRFISFRLVWSYVHDFSWLFIEGIFLTAHKVSLCMSQLVSILSFWFYYHQRRLRLLLSSTYCTSLLSVIFTTKDPAFTSLLPTVHTCTLGQTPLDWKLPIRFCKILHCIINKNYTVSQQESSKSVEDKNRTFIGW